MEGPSNLPLPNDDRDFLHALIGDGRPLLTFTGLSLVLSGGFALFLSATHQFLPQDVQFLGLTANQLCAFDQCRIVHFMIHDRVSFGGALIAVGSLYLWLAEFPLARREPWAWWLFVVSGLLGFGSFLAYLGYGYLDTWHGAATLLLLPVFLAGLVRTRALLPRSSTVRCLFECARPVAWKSTAGVGRALLLATAGGMICGGLTIMLLGMTRVFVPQDLKYMGLLPADLQAISPRLVPLIAHDRAGFGGAICTCGVLVFFCIWCAIPSRSLWQVLAWSGAVGFGCAIGIHPVIGYMDFTHLAPAVMGALMFLMGMILSCRWMSQPIVGKPRLPENA